MAEKSDKTWDELLDAADAWVIRLCSDTVTANDKKCFSAWLGQSELHQKVFDRTINVLEVGGILSYLPEYSAENNLKNLRKTEKIISSTKLAILKISLTVCYFLGLAILLMSAPNNSQNRQVYGTVAGQQRVIELPDGSRVELNTRSQLSVDYSNSQRQLTL